MSQRTVLRFSLLMRRAANFIALCMSLILLTLILWGLYEMVVLIPMLANFYAIGMSQCLKTLKLFNN